MFGVYIMYIYIYTYAYVRTQKTIETLYSNLIHATPANP